MGSNEIVVGQNKSTKEVEYSCKSSNMLVGSETFRTRSAYVLIAWEPTLCTRWNLDPLGGVFIKTLCTQRY